MKAVGVLRDSTAMIISTTKGKASQRCILRTYLFRNLDVYPPLLLR
jgi:hypothetical protein